MIKNKQIFYIFLILLQLIILGCGGGGGSGGGNSGSGSSDGKINLAWDSVTDPSLAGYKIYYGPVSRTVSGRYGNSNDIGMGTQISNTTTTATLAGLNKGQTYYIAVTAYDNIGGESDFSNELSGTAK